MASLDVRMLVQWPGGPDSPIGVVTALGGPQVEPGFYADGDVKVFNALLAGSAGPTTM